MKTVKKLAALALALAMALTALPAGAFAAGGEETPTEQPAFGGSAHVYVGMFESPEQNAGFDSTQVWSTSQGQSFMVGFEAADGALVTMDKVEYTGAVLGDQPAADTAFTVTEGGVIPNLADTYLNVSVAADAAPGDYTLSFTVDGAQASVAVKVSEKAGQGGTDPLPGPPQLQYASSPAGPWTDAPQGGIPQDLPAGGKIYFQVVQGGAVLTVTASLDAGSVGEAVLEGAGEDGTVTGTGILLTGGSVNGRVQVNFTFAGGSTSFAVSVTGNSAAEDLPSGYADAQVKQAFADSGVVTFEGVTGPADGGDFTLENGVLSFDTAGRAPGLYEAAAGGQKYVVAVMNPLPAQSVAPITVRMTDYQPASLSAQGKADGFYYYNGVSEAAEAKQLVFQPGDEYGTLHPIYIYQVKDGALCDIVGTSQSGMAGDIHQYFRVQSIDWTADGGSVKVLKVSVENNVPVGATLFFTLSILDGNMEFAGTMEIIKGDLYGSDSFGFTEDYAAVGGDDPAALSYIHLNVEAGSAASQHDYYITKGSGDNGNGQYARYDFALYDDIDISTLTVTSSNVGLATVEQYLEKTPDGDNAIGLRVKVNDTSTPGIAEITVSFNDKAGAPHIYRGAVFCYEPPHYDSVTVSSAVEFEAAYSSMLSGTIYLESGTYSMDILHNKDIAIRAAEGAEVVINGENATNGNAIITIGAANPAPITGITIDGRGARDGIDPNGNNCYVSELTVRNCITGVRGTGTFAIEATNSRFENNILAIQGVAAALRVNGCTFSGNTTAVDFGASLYTVCRVQMNLFTGNTNDFRVRTNYNNITATQNYYEHGGAAAKPAILTVNDPAGAPYTGKVYYSPWFVDQAMTLYTADLAGAKPGSARAAEYTVPVDRTLSSASLLDSALFAEMKSTAAAVSIPVTEQVEDKALVTTIWEFDSGKLASSLPDRMDLEVTDAPADAAKAVVDKVVANPEAIAQYVHFSHDGALPGEATVLVRKTAGTTADDLKLYYIDTASGTVKEADIVAVSETTVDGVDYYVVTVAHCSEYLIAGAITLKEESAQGGGTAGDGGSAGTTGGESAPAPTPAPATQAAPAPSATPAPAAGSANRLVSALEVEERFAAAAEAEVTFAVDRKPLVSAGAFGILVQHPDKTLVLEGEGYTWRFEGAAITDAGAIEGASFDTTVSLTSPNAHLMQPLLQDMPAIHLYFSYHGALPGPARVSVQVGAEQADSVKYLYYFNPTAVVLEYVGEAQVDGAGVATFTIEHCSDYVLLDEKLEDAPAAPEATQAPAPTQAPEATQAPAAGETGAEAGGIGFILAAVAVAAVLAAVVLLLVRRRKGE